jgi:hypothetical protein
VWRADDFTVGGGGWSVDTVSTLVYDTGFAAIRISDATLSIRQTDVNGAVVATGSATWGLAGVNRIFNGVGNLQNADRQLNRLTANMGGVNLAPGTYAFVFTVTPTAGQNIWSPYVMDPNPANPDDPITRVGNGMVSVDSGVTWNPATVATGGWNQSPELVFDVQGTAVPEPGTFIAIGIGLAGLALARRRK